MFLLDTDMIISDLMVKGFDEKNAKETAKTFEPYEGIEVKMYTDSNHGFIPGMRKYMEIPRSWCRLEFK